MAKLILSDDEFNSLPDAEPVSNKIVLSDDEFNSLPDAEPVSNKIVLSDDEFNSLPDAPATPEVEPITMTPNEPTPVADALTNAGKGIAHLFGERLYSEPPDQTQTEVIPQELDMSSMQAARDRQAMLPPSMPQEPGYVPEGGLLSAAKASVPIAYQGTKLGILGAAQAAGENMPYGMENFMPPIPPELQADLAQRMAKTPMTPENIAKVQAPAAIEEIKRIREENQIRPGTVGSVATDVASSVAQFGPIAAASLIAPVVAPAGLAFLATVSGGQQYNKAREAGFTEEQALAQGVAFGAAEAIGEKIGLDYLIKSLSNPALMSGIKGILKTAVKNAGVEGGEEMLTQGLQNATEIIAKKINPQTKGEAPTLLQDVPYAGFVGGLSGAGMGAIGAAIQNYANPPKQEAPPQPEQEQAKAEQPVQESPTATEPPPQKMEQTTEELVVPPEPAPTVIEQPQPAEPRLERAQPEFQREPRPEMQAQPIDQLFKRKPAVTVGEAERVQGEAIPEGKSMTATGQPTPEAMLTRTNKTSLLSEEKFWEIVETAKSQDEIRPYAEQVLKNKAAFSSDAQQIAARAMPEIQKEANTRYEQNKKDIMGRYERSKEFVMESIGGETPLLKKLGYDINGKMYRGVKSEAAINDLFTKKSVMTKTGEGTTNWAPDTYSRYMFDKDTHSGYIIESDATPDNFQTFTKFSNKYYKSKGPIPLENISRIIKIERTKPEVGVNKDTVGHEVIYDRDAGINKIKSVQPTKPSTALDQMAVKTPEVKGPSNVEIAQQNFNRIMNAQPYELTLEDYIYQKQQKARVYRKPTGQKDRQEMKSRIREVGDQYAPDEHKNAVKRALAEGKPVPPEVLAEYPELKVEQKAEGKPKEYGYEMNARPFSIGAQPKGHTRVDEGRGGRWGTIYYDKPLTETEIRKFELKPIENESIKLLPRILPKTFEYGDKPTEKKYYKRMGANEKERVKEGFEEVPEAKPFKVTGVTGDYFITKVENKDYGKRYIHAKYPQSKTLYVVSDGETGYEILSVPTVKEATEKLKTLFDSGKLRNTIDDMIKSKGRSPRYNKATPRPKSGPGMFGGAQLQNAYEKVEPVVKRGLDIFKKKTKEFIADEEGFYSPEELAKAVKAVKDKFIGSIKRGQSTQVTNTVNTYAKILDRIADKAQGKVGDVRVVDVSTGLGMSKELAENLGYKNYETTEPFPAKGFVPTFKDSSQLQDNAYDFITNNQVLNVVPKEIRDGIVKDIGRALKEGGTAIISTRGKDVMAATTGRPGEEPMSLYIPAKDVEGKSYEQYQKGFTNQELKDYVQGLLGDGFEVKTAPFGAAGVEIIKSKTKEAKPGRVGMLGAGTMQNLYEKAEPTLKKGADLLFKKGKQAYEAARRNADVTRDMGRVVDITEKNGKAVETEAPKRGTRIGMFNLQDVYDMVTKPFTKRAEDEKLKRHLDTNIDADVRKSMEEARGIEPLPFTERAKQAITNIKNQVTRKFPDLDDRKYPELADRLRVLSEARDYADGNADAIIRDNIKDLSQQEYNEFSNKLILEDIKRGLENGLYTTNDLPFNLTPQKLDNALKQLSPAELTAKGFGETSKRIEDAIQKRNDAFRSVKQRSVDLGILPQTIMNDDRYFHHQVLYYMNMQDAIRAGKTGVRLGKKSYTIGRQKDSLSDFNTEYAQAEFEVLSDMVEDQQKAEFIKYVESLDLTPQLKAEALAQNLPQDRKTLQKLMPDTHETWQPKEGNNFYKVFTIPERIVNEILKSQDAVDVGLDDINEALAVGGPKRELILPKDITKTLDEFGKKTAPDNVLHKFSQLTNKAFKTLALFMPSRATNYMLTNAFGDADVVMAYALDGMKRLPEAVKELIKGDRKNNKDLEDAYKYRVIGTGITEKEISEMSYDKVMKNITLKQILNPIAWGKKYLETVGRINAMRENSLRYAMFKNFLERFRNGEKNIYGASDRQSIDNLPDDTQKAARLARDLMGDYGNVSALGDYIAKYHIPFYRWMEINMPRYYRMLKNAPFEGGYQGALKGGAKTMKRFVQMNIMGAVLYQLYHAALGAITGDDELRKARDVSKAKGQPHVIVPNYLIGNDVKDDVKTVRAQSAFSDVTELLLGTSDWFSDAMDVATGKMKFGEKMRDLGWKFDTAADLLNTPPVRKYLMAAWPVQRFAAEMMFGKAPTKKPTELRTIRDRQQHLARFLTLGTPYNIAADKPAPKKGIADAILYTTDLGEAAYNEMMSKKMEYLRNKGLPIPTAAESPAGTAYYNLKQAMKYGDKTQTRKYFKEYNEERRKSGREPRLWDEVIEDVKQGVELDAGMNTDLFNGFMKTLTPDEKRKLRQAMRWVKKTYK